MQEQRSEEPQRGRVDAVSIAYIAFGVPGIVGFLVVLFGLVNACDRIPA